MTPVLVVVLLAAVGAGVYLATARAGPGRTGGERQPAQPPPPPPPPNRIGNMPNRYPCGHPRETQVAGAFGCAQSGADAAAALGWGNQWRIGLRPGTLAGDGSPLAAIPKIGGLFGMIPIQNEVIYRIRHGQNRCDENAEVIDVQFLCPPAFLGIRCC